MVLYIDSRIYTVDIKNSIQDNIKNMSYVVLRDIIESINLMFKKLNGSH